MSLQPKLQFDQLRKWAYIRYHWEFFHYIPSLTLSLSLLNLCGPTPSLFIVFYLYLPVSCMCSPITAPPSVSSVRSALHLPRLVLSSCSPPPLSILCPP